MKTIFKSPRIFQRMHDGPLGSYVESYAAEMREQGYCAGAMESQIRLVADFSRPRTHGQIKSANDSVILQKVKHDGVVPIRSHGQGRRNQFHLSPGFAIPGLNDDDPLDSKSNVGKRRLSRHVGRFRKRPTGGVGLQSYVGSDYRETGHRVNYGYGVSVRGVSHWSRADRDRKSFRRSDNRRPEQIP